MTDAQSDHMELQDQIRALEETIKRLQEERTELRDALRKTAGLPIAMTEYQRRSSLVQASQGRLDQTLALLAAGYAILASGVAGLVSGLWTTDRTTFFWTTAGLATAASLFAAAIFLRDLVTRLYQTSSEQAQARLRNYFVQCSPEIVPYLSDRFWDDWPTPYSVPKKSYSYLMWRILLAAASFNAGAALSLVLAASHVLPDWASPVIGAAAWLLLYAALLFALKRFLAGKARSYQPQFPRPKVGD